VISLRIDGETKVFLLLGQPVSHSLSPLLHNTAFETLGLNCVYLAAPVAPETLPEALSGLKALNIGGGNITAPYKEAVLPYLDHISPTAHLIRSVNTLITREGKLWGDSTDGPGFIRALREAAPEEALKEPLLIVGAGGAARAVAYSLAEAGASKLQIVNRSAGRAEELAALLESGTGLNVVEIAPLEPAALQRCLERCRVVIYALPGDSPELAQALAGLSSLEGHYFFDLRYHPSETALMGLFQQRGGKAWNGKKMLLWQAALAFEQFTGLAAPLEAMRRAMGEE
jgi:shikimate dehydrogenase